MALELSENFEFVNDFRGFSRIATVVSVRLQSMNVTRKTGYYWVNIARCYDHLKPVFLLIFTKNRIS